MARRLAIHPASVSAFKSGASTPSLTTLRLFSQVLGKPLRIAGEEPGGGARCLEDWEERVLAAVSLAPEADRERVVDAISTLIGVMRPRTAIYSSKGADSPVALNDLPAGSGPRGGVKPPAGPALTETPGSGREAKALEAAAAALQAIRAEESGRSPAAAGYSGTAAAPPPGARQERPGHKSAPKRVRGSLQGGGDSSKAVA